MLFVLLTPLLPSFMFLPCCVVLCCVIVLVRVAVVEGQGGIILSTKQSELNSQSFITNKIAAAQWSFSPCVSKNQPILRLISTLLSGLTKYNPALSGRCLCVLLRNVYTLTAPIDWLWRFPATSSTSRSPSHLAHYRQTTRLCDPQLRGGSHSRPGYLLLMCRSPHSQ